MRKTEGKYKGYYWYWYPDFGVYCCGTTPKRLWADTLKELKKLIDEYVPIAKEVMED